MAWCIASVAKLTLEIVTGKGMNLARLVGTGGMPSTHTAAVACVCSSLALIYGFDSHLWGLSFAFMLVVAFDALGIRREAGRQAEALNFVIEKIHEKKFFTVEDWKELKTLVGHSPGEVMVGGIIGILVSILVHGYFHSPPQILY